MDLRISFEARVTDLMQVGFLENIPEKIIDNIQIGVEAGYNEGLKKVRKGITIAQLEECAEHLYELDLQDKAFFFFYYRISLGNNYGNKKYNFYSSLFI